MSIPWKPMGSGPKKGDAFAKRLARSVDWEESVFRQTNRRCAFLEDNNLCALYTAMGPETLCDTCRNYPRHMEEFRGPAGILPFPVLPGGGTDHPHRGKASVLP